MADIKQALEMKLPIERADFKSEEICKLSVSGKYTDKEYGVDVEIQSVSKIDRGIEVLVRGWKDGKPLGFGPDGSVELERIKIHNPPLMIVDPTGDVVREHTDPEGNLHTKRLKEDPVAALRQSLGHIVSLIGKENRLITKGKIGNTTSTFFPDADAETTTVDGWITRGGTNLTWSNIRDTTTGTTADDNDAGNNPVVLQAGTTAWNDLRRGVFLFDTSSIPDTDTISSATFSLHGGSDGTSDAFSLAINVYSSNPASNTALATTDYDLGDFGTTPFSDSNITAAAWNNTGYNNFTLNASGIANISKTGVSKFGLRSTADATNTEPSHSASAIAYIGCDCAETGGAGTTTDPKLVVEHAAGGNLKTWNGLAEASIKTINGLEYAESLP